MGGIGGIGWISSSTSAHRTDAPERPRSGIQDYESVRMGRPMAAKIQVGQYLVTGKPR